MIKLTYEQVLKLYRKMIKTTGGYEGIRDENTLKSSLINAYATFDGNDLYPTIEDKCANICFSIINNHPFVDGNKRMGVYIMLIILELSHISIKYDQTELVDLGLNIAKGIFNQKNIVNWIKQHEIKD